MDRLSSAKRVAGIKQTRNAIASGDAAVVYVACDADAARLAEIMELCARCGVEIVSNHSGKELSKACRIDVSCSAAAILK